MIKIIKNIKYMKILMKNSLMSPEVKQSLAHAEKNFINLDGSQDSSSDNTSRESIILMKMTAITHFKPLDLLLSVTALQKLQFSKT